MKINCLQSYRNSLWSFDHFIDAADRWGDIKYSNPSIRLLVELTSLLLRLYY